jgi:predicted ABC-type ATPase
MDENRFQLKPRKHAAIYEKIERHHFKNTEPTDRPQAVILGGQPGAGKSGLLEASKQGFADHNVVAINGDELRYYHPQYRDIQKADERRFAELTDPHARPWTKQLFDRTIETRRNVVFEGTMREAGPITETMRRLKAAGYYVVARVIAANERDSMTGIHRRYEEQKAAKGFGRWSNVQAHDDAYKGMPATVEYIERNKLADRVQVYDRKGNVLYDNELQGNEWKRQPAAKTTIEAERERPPTPEDRRQQEAEWATIIAMMAARGADEREIERVREVARQYGGQQYPEHKPAEYERQDYGRRPADERPEMRAPETGKTYQGPIVSADDKYVIQSVREAGRELYIQHERLVLNSNRGELLNAGSNVEIRYPYNRVGIVKEWGEKEIQGPASKGIEPKDFGKR